MKYLKIDVSWREAMLIPFTPAARDLLASISEVIYIEEIAGKDKVYKRKERSPDMQVVDEPTWHVDEPVVEAPLPSLRVTPPKTSLDEDIPF